MKISKQKKIKALIFIITCVIGFTIYLNLKNLHVKFYNKTGENLDSLVIAETFIGHLKKDNSTEIIDFKDFYFDGTLPYEQISATIKGKKLNKLHWSWCGTNGNKKSKGSFIFDIKKQIDEKGNICLYLVEHNQKMFWE
ncbi:hypothetical protein GKZ90_0008615 [Flavobacterium sp. MC2016-06]|uniref:hypothetical protein n=1 Tax=Flavobacterium sp. MC2016-06 TaxID=2676308 RepID=UPI0012BA6274|nr:hypothetical protein [Flavobacterium sp. MC2016-06]MBU3857908.1 hypothetical protein [Flavobacterium sp. MC2016-06]